MRALYFQEHGDAHVLKIGDLPKPELQDGEALVRVRAVALNHLDIWVRRGWKGLQLKLPHIGGSDICGELVEIRGESSHQIGDRLIVYPGIEYGDDRFVQSGVPSLSPNYKIIGEHIPGGFAEFVVVPIQNLFTKPPGWSDVQAAAPLLVGTTVWRMLFQVAKARAGETLLIVGSGGGVNQLSLLIAKKCGLQLLVVAGGSEKAKRATELGADLVINYHEQPDWHRAVLKATQGMGVDIVVDNVGKESLTKSMHAVRRGGRIVTVGNTTGAKVEIDNRLIFGKQISLLGSTMGSRLDFEQAVNFMVRHKIDLPIDSVLPLEKGIEALEKMERGEHFGKIVLTPEG